MFGETETLVEKKSGTSWEELGELQFEEMRKDLYEKEKDYFLRTGKRYPTSMSLEAEEFYLQKTGKECRVKYSEELEKLYRANRSK